MNNRLKKKFLKFSQEKKANKKDSVAKHRVEPVHSVGCAGQTYSSSFRLRRGSPFGNSIIIKNPPTAIISTEDYRAKFGIRASVGGLARPVLGPVSAFAFAEFGCCSPKGDSLSFHAIACN